MRKNKKKNALIKVCYRKDLAKGLSQMQIEQKKLPHKLEL